MEWLLLFFIPLTLLIIQGFLVVLNLKASKIIITDKELIKATRFKTEKVGIGEILEIVMPATSLPGFLERGRGFTFHIGTDLHLEFKLKGGGSLIIPEGLLMTNSNLSIMQGFLKTHPEIKQSDEVKEFARNGYSSVVLNKVYPWRRIVFWLTLFFTTSLAVTILFGLLFNNI